MALSDRVWLVVRGEGGGKGEQAGKGREGKVEGMRSREWLEESTRKSWGRRS